MADGWSTARITHIAERAAWEGAAARGTYVAPSLETEGFIHCSTPWQVRHIANINFAGRDDLVLLEIDPSNLDVDVVFENCEGGSEPFPHIYGELPVDAVTSVTPLEWSELERSFRIPDVLGRDAAIELVERWLGAFDDGWPSDELLDELLAPGVRFLERPNVFNQAGSDRDRATMLAGVDIGRSLLASQRFEPLAHVVDGDTVVTRMRWTGELAKDAGPYRAGTTLTAWCVAHCRIVDGRIAHIEQHDCYETPLSPKT